MNVELLITDSDNNHTSELCCDAYSQLKPRTNTEPGCDSSCPTCANRGPCTPSGVTCLRAPLISRDPQTSSLDRYTPNCHMLFHSPRPEKKHSPFFCKLKKNINKRSKSAQSSPVHSIISAEVQDLGCCNGHELIESNLDFGFREESPYSWAGSNESFSDLDRGMTRSRLVPPNQFPDTTMSCSSSGYSLSNNELSSCHSSESISQQLVSPIHHGLITTMYGSVLQKSCENILNLTAKNQKSLSCRNARSKSSGGMIIQKFSKKLSKLTHAKGSEGGSGGGSKKKKGRANSTSNLEGAEK